eukprot:1181221-Prorocentrum_minimum.AAC.2
MKRRASELLGSDQRNKKSSTECIDLCAPGITPRSPPGFTPRSPVFTPRSPVFTPRIPVFTPRIPGFKPRIPGFTPRIPGFKPRIPGCTPRSPVFTPRIPAFTPRIPGFTLTLTCSGSRDSRSSLTWQTGMSARGSSSCATAVSGPRSAARPPRAPSASRFRAATSPSRLSTEAMPATARSTLTLPAVISTTVTCTAHNRSLPIIGRFQCSVTEWRGEISTAVT